MQCAIHQQQQVASISCTKLETNALQHCRIRIEGHRWQFPAEDNAQQVTASLAV
jgi:hypothetical protein